MLLRSDCRLYLGKAEHYSRHCWDLLHLLLSKMSFHCIKGIRFPRNQTHDLSVASAMLYTMWSLYLCCNSHSQWLTAAAARGRKSKSDWSTDMTQQIPALTFRKHWSRHFSRQYAQSERTEKPKPSEQTMWAAFLGIIMLPLR